MKSDMIHVTSEGAGLNEALMQADAVAAFKKLPKKAAIQLRLLTEEMMGMLNGLTGNAEAEFWIDDDGEAFRLHLLTEVNMNYRMREKLLSTSSSGKNAAAKGVMGKIRDLFERAIEPYDDGIPDYYATGWIAGGADSANLTMAAAGIWSFNRYRESVFDGKKETEEWDELEKSIVANIADDIQISIRNDKVELVITKKI